MASFRFSLLLVLSLFACQPETKSLQNQDYDPSAPETGMVEHITEEAEANRKALPPISPFPETLKGKPGSFYLQHPQTPEDAIAFSQGVWRARKDDRTISLLKQLTDLPEELSPFAFFLLNRMVQETGTELSDVLGSHLLLFIQSHPQAFADYFSDSSQSQTAIISHANLIGYELILQTDSQEELRAFQEEIQTNCEDCSLDEQAILEDFIGRVSEIVQTQHDKQ